ncbi:MAG: hypothetical protein M1830_004499 [Pleopsidium flavum]|nr:MAG: hypothetical protein M1830_004499 [Pleopsidium flavum]
MSSYLLSDYSAHLPTPTPPPPQTSPKWAHIEVNQTPILERENDDDGPPPVRGHVRRNSPSLPLPPAPPTSRGPSFDEPLCSQNARSSADLWLVKLWFEQRLGRTDTRIDLQTSHNPRYVDTDFLPGLFWDGGYDSRGTLIQSYHSSEDDDDTATSESSSTMGAWSRSTSSKDSISTYPAAFENQLTSKHRNFATDSLWKLGKVTITASKPCSLVEIPLQEIATTFPSTTTQPTHSYRTLRQGSYVECKKLSDSFIDNTLSARALCPSSDHSGRRTRQPDVFKSCSRGQSPDHRAPAEPTASNVERSVWEPEEPEEPEGRFKTLASKLHLPMNLGRGQLRTKMARFSRCFLCCRTDEEGS